MSEPMPPNGNQLDYRRVEDALHAQVRTLKSRVRGLRRALRYHECRAYELDDGRLSCAFCEALRADSQRARRGEGGR